MKRLFFRFWPILFILFVWFLFSYPYFILGKVPYASTYEDNFFAPWSHYESFNIPIKNNAMPDVHTQIYPWKKFTIDTLKEGHIPFWNPFSFSGTPHMANFQSAVFSPLNILFFILPFIDAWSILVLLQPCLASFFMYLFMRSLGVSRLGSGLSSVVFMFCGFVVVWMAYGTLAYAIIYLPLALFAVEKFEQTKKKFFLLLLALAIPLSFFSGHFQISFYFLLTVFFYCIFKGLSRRNLPVTCYTLCALVVGLFLSLPQIMPSIELYQNSVRSGIFQISEAIPFQYLVTTFAPDFFGNPVTRNDWFGHYAEWAGFVGVIPLMLAVYTVVRKPNQTVWFFLLVGAVALAFAVRSPLSEFIVLLKIPVISTSALSRIIVLFSFAIAVLSGFGLDRLKKDIERKKTGKRLIVLILTTAGILGAIWVLTIFTQLLPSQWQIVAKRNLILPTMIFLIGVVPFFVSPVIKTKKIALFTYILLIITTFDSFRFAQKWMPFDPRNLVYPDIPIIDEIKNNISEGRIFGNLGGEATIYYSFPSIEGYDPLYIRRYGEFIQSAANGQFTTTQRSVVKLQRDAMYADRVLDLLGVTLIFHPIADTNQGWAYPVWKDNKRYTLLYQDNTFQLFRNNMALPRATLFYDYEIKNDDKGIISRFYSSDFDFRSKVLLEVNPGVDPAKNGQGSAKIISYKPDTISIDVTTNQPALLFLSDNFYPGWNAKVNDKLTQIYRTNYSFRSVVVPSGNSVVEFNYENWHF